MNIFDSIVCCVKNKWAEICEESGDAGYIALTETWLKGSFKTDLLCPRAITPTNRIEITIRVEVILLFAYHYQPLRGTHCIQAVSTVVIIRQNQDSVTAVVIMG